MNNQVLRHYSSRAFLCAFILLGGLRVSAQTPSPTPSPIPQTSSNKRLERDFFKNILSDQKAIWTAPFHLHSRNARWLAPLGLGTAALITTDRNTADEMAESRDQLTPSRTISYIGSTYGVGGIAATFYLVGRATHSDRARETGILGGEALIDSMIFVTAIKEITQRPRPTAGRERGEFFNGGTSFPSGHSIQAWSLATIIANEYHDHRAIEIAAYGIASAVSVARFTGRNHFLSDILVGSAMGYGIGRYVYKTHHVKRSAAGNEEEESFEPHRRWPAITPVYSRAARVYGVGLAWSF
jgi:membrane-associated phospholipid phosphatase